MHSVQNTPKPNPGWKNLSPGAILGAEWMETLSPTACRLYARIYNAWNYHGDKSVKMNNENTASALKVLLDQLTQAQRELESFGLLRLQTKETWTRYRYVEASAHE